MVGQDHEELASQLEEFAEGSQIPEIVGRITDETKNDLVFMFAGQGTQWLGMGRQLFDWEPVFRVAIEECDTLFKRHVKWSLLEVLQADEQSARLNETEVAQVVLFAIQVALAALWRSWGITPGAVVGHSVGDQRAPNLKVC